MFKKTGAFVCTFILALMMTLDDAKADSVHDPGEIGPGVELERQDIRYGGNPQSTRIMRVENNPYVRFHMGYQGPRSLHRLTSYANSHPRADDIIGGINGSFFNLSISAHPNMVYPSYLLAEHNRILHLGSMSNDSSGFLGTPAAFGIDRDGNPMIAPFELDITAETSSGSVKIDRINTSRGAGEVILYTPGQRRTATPTNEFGREFTVTDTSKRINDQLSFGDSVRGSITNMKEYGRRNASPIPGDGFIISGHGSTLDGLLDGVRAGDDIEVTVDIEDRWKDAEMIMATGPLLVQNGRVDITMSSSASTYSVPNPRSGIGIDAQGNTMFVTVDGRQSGYSQGMTIPQFANYMRDQGAVMAINLDGGGSTTMVARDFSRDRVSLANSPSDGAERALSSSLLIINDAPEGIPYFASFDRERWAAPRGERVTIVPDYILDGKYNLLDPGDFEARLIAEGLTVDGSSLSGDVPGTYAFTYQVGNVEKEFEFTVLDDLVSLNDGFGEGQTSAIRAVASADVMSTDVAGTDRDTITKQYNLQNGEVGIAAAYWTFRSPLEIKAKPEKLGLWVYGEGQKHWLRGTVRGPDGTQGTIDFTEEGGLDWYGWKYVTADMSGVKEDSQLTRIYVAETEEANRSSAVIQYAGLHAHYAEVSPAYIAPDSKADDVPADKVWTVAFSAPVHHGVNRHRMYVEDETGRRVDLDFDYGEDSHTVEIAPQSGVYEEGLYRLVVTRSVVSLRGNALEEEERVVFRVTEEEASQRAE